LVRIVAQFDIENGAGKLVNYYYDEFIDGNVPVVEVVVSVSNISPLV